MKKMFVFCTAISMLLFGIANAQISLNGGLYTENFDSIGASGTTLPSYWTAVTTGSGAGTTPPNPLYLPLTSGTVIGGISNGNYNAGLTSGNTGDRSIGVYTTASGDTKHITAQFINNTGQIISSFNVSYLLEAWYSRYDSATPRNFCFRMQYSTDGATFTDMPGFGTSVNNSGVAVNGGLWLLTPITASILSLQYTPAVPLNPNDMFYLRWNGLGCGDANTRHMVGSIDDFTIEFGEEPTPATPFAVAVPSMTEWGILIFILFAGLGSVVYLRKARRA